MDDTLDKQLERLKLESIERTKAMLFEERDLLIRCAKRYKRCAAWPSMQATAQEGLSLIRSRMKEIKADLAKLF
tara:strand:+ start:344 stop:565 length:222 start_codon:yes stop_codon:yes gene_type:complete